LSSSLGNVKLRLAFFSGNRCAFPGCTQALATEDTPHSSGAIIGEAAHIVGEKPGSERHDPSYPADKLNAFENLIYLCPTDHTKIDKKGNGFSVETIRAWKHAHETKVKAAIEDAIADVSFTELEVVTRALLTSATGTSSDLSLTPPDAKIAKNGLSPKIRFLLTVGLSKSEEVRSFIEQLSAILPGFDERLVNGFKGKYDHFKSAGISGDDLFVLLNEFSSQQSPDATLQAAGLAVLSHLFETCDVFEK